MVLDVAVPTKVPAEIQVLDDVCLYLNSYQAAPETAGHVMVALVPVTEDVLITGGKEHPDATVVVNVPVIDHGLGVPLVQNVLPLKLYEVFDVKPVINLLTAEPFNVPNEIQVPEEVGLYSNSYQATPDTAAQFSVADVAVVVVAENTIGEPQPPPRVVKNTDALQGPSL